MKAPIDISREEGNIVIRVREDDIPNILYQEIEVRDADAFAFDLVSVLSNEEEDGMTLVHRMLDNAVDTLADCGADSFHFRDDPYSEDEEEYDDGYDDEGY